MTKLPSINGCSKLRIFCGQRMYVHPQIAFYIFLVWYPQNTIPVFSQTLYNIYDLIFALTK